MPRLPPEAPCGPARARMPPPAGRSSAPPSQAPSLPAPPPSAAASPPYLPRPPSCADSHSLASCSVAFFAARASNSAACMAASSAARSSARRRFAFAFTDPMRRLDPCWCSRLLVDSGLDGPAGTALGLRRRLPRPTGRLHRLRRLLRRPHARRRPPHARRSGHALPAKDAVGEFRPPLSVWFKYPLATAHTYLATQVCVRFFELRLASIDFFRFKKTTFERKLL